MEPPVALVLAALCALLGGACSCEFEEHEARAPEPLLLASPLERVLDADADSCRARCCAQNACDAAVLALPQDAHAQCFLLSCGGACPLRDDQNSQYKVFTRSDEHAPDTTVRRVPLMLAPGTRTGDQQNSTNGTTADVCALPLVVGVCKAAFPRFYFDAESGSCRRFIYGGCDANGNNFETREECEAACPGVKGADEEEKPQTKTARMAPPPQTELSEDTEESAEVKEMAQDDYSERCLAPPVVGWCRGSFPRWFFNESSGRCQRFVYGGCRGNKNNYENEELCASTCTEVKVLPSVAQIPERSDDFTVKVLPKTEIPEMSEEFKEQCMAPREVGRCRGAFPRWFFNSESGECQSFIYGGCGGNQNNYQNKELCTSTCTASVGAYGNGRNHWTAAFFLFLALAAISFLLLSALIFITLRRSHQLPRRALSVRSDHEELLPDSERSSVDSLPLPESPGKA